MRESLNKCLKMKKIKELQKLSNSSIVRKIVLSPAASSALLIDWWHIRDSRDRRRVRFRSLSDSLRGRTLVSSRMKLVKLRRSSRNRLQSWSRRFSHWSSSRSTSCSPVLKTSKSALATLVSSSRRSKTAKTKRMDQSPEEEVAAKAKIRRESERIKISKMKDFEPQII